MYHSFFKSSPRRCLLILEREEERETWCGRETSTGCLPHASRLGIGPTDFWCTGWHSVQLSRLARAHVSFLIPRTPKDKIPLLMVSEHAFSEAHFRLFWKWLLAYSFLCEAGTLKVLEINSFHLGRGKSTLQFLSQVYRAHRALAGLIIRRT